MDAEELMRIRYNFTVLNFVISILEELKTTFEDYYSSPDTIYYQQLTNSYHSAGVARGILQTVIQSESAKMEPPESPEQSMVGG